MQPRATLLTFAGLVGLTALAAAQEPADPYAGRIHKASDEPLRTLKRMQIPKGMQAELTAAEPLLANPIAFCFDHQGRIYVAESFRLHKGVPDNRGHMNWLDVELANRTVADRIAMYKKFKHYDKWGKEHDRIRKLWDADGDGKMDRAAVFADGFKNPEDGLGSGVLARDGKVYYTCIPDLWLLEDTNGDHRADRKKSLHHGYGIHVAFLGHDLHGLIVGPDGKLYFSVGDRGAHIEKDGKVLVSQPDTGSVFRCDLDGSNLEIFHTGLRNPQELAFDDHGNLFTGDNNADGGDQARWVHLVEGGDSGWRIGYQYLKNLGPWKNERIWEMDHPGRPAAHLPPLAHIGSGPSGLTSHPGVSLLPEKYRDHFFLVDFRGGSGNSGVHAFTMKPKGATFDVAGRHNFVWSLLATDADFGPDGGFYLLDWTEGWGMPNKGRIFKVFDPERVKDPLVAETKGLLAEGMAKRNAAELSRLLGHADRRVRLEAQLALAERGGSEELRTAALKGKGLARLHGIWGLGQLARKDVKAVLPLLPCLDDSLPEVRAQAAKVLGASKCAEAYAGLVKGLSDAEPRVRFHAAQALGQLGKTEAIGPLFDLLKRNGDQDRYLRHAAAFALVRLGDQKALLQAAADPSVPVRRGALLALRRLKSPDVAVFLNDAEPELVLEAARAINDEPIAAALPALAELLKGPIASAKLPGTIAEPLLFRALNAHFRLGKQANAHALAAFATRSGVSDKLRLEALKMLGDWEKPSGRDRVVGLWRALPERPRADAVHALQTNLAGIMTASDKVRAEGARLAGKYGIGEVGPALRALVADAKRPTEVRVESLQALAALKDGRLKEAAELAVRDEDPRLRHQGRRILLQGKDPAAALTVLQPVLEKGATVERQGALAILAGIKAGPADEVLGIWLDRLLENKVPAELKLDVLEAAKARGTAALKKKLARYEAALPKDPVGRHEAVLAGGDAESGRRIFFEKSELSCVRCHKVGGVGGDVGPELKGIGAKQNRRYLLEAIVDPSKQTAKGYETLVLVLTNGQVKTGILKSETKKEVTLMDAEGKTHVVPTAQIEQRATGPSAMPADLPTKMSRRELRDLVEYLSTLK